MINKEEQKEQKKYKSNPSIQNALKETVKGYRSVTAKSTNTSIVVYNKENESEEELRELLFSTKQEVDKSQFVKLFMSGFGALSNLKVGAKLLFEYVFHLIQQETGRDKVYFNYKDYLEFCAKDDLKPMSQASFYRNLNELLENEILFSTENSHWYFINVSYMFNGDRLSFLRTYDLKKD